MGTPLTGPVSPHRSTRMSCRHRRRPRCWRWFATSTRWDRDLGGQQGLGTHPHPCWGSTGCSLAGGEARSLWGLKGPEDPVWLQALRDVGALRERPIKRIFFLKNSRIWSGAGGAGRGWFCPTTVGRGSWALGQWDQPPDPGMLQRFTKNPLEDSQGTLLSTSLRSRTFPLSKSWEAALVSVFLLALTALNSTISGALSGPSQFPPVLLHSQPAGLGWRHSWWLPEHL